MTRKALGSPTGFAAGGGGADSCALYDRLNVEPDATEFERIVDTVSEFFPTETTGPSPVFPADERLRRPVTRDRVFGFFFFPDFGSTSSSSSSPSPPTKLRDEKD